MNKILTLFAVIVFTLFASKVSYSAEPSETITQESGESHMAIGLRDNQLWVEHKFKLKQGWHIYWKNPGDAGLPVEIKWQLPAGFSAGEIAYPPPARKELLGITSFVYDGQASLFIPINANNSAHNLNDKTLITAKAEWLACKDICIPEQAEYNLIFSKNELEDFTDKLNILPKNIGNAGSYYVDDNQVTIKIPTANLSLNNKISANFLPETMGIIDHTAPKNIDISDQAITMVFGKAEYQAETDIFKGLLLVTDASGKQHSFDVALQKSSSAIELSSSEPANSSETISFFTALIFAFIGGLILNFMPCVLPVISLKIFDIIKKLELSRKESLGHSIAYTLGILVFFLSIATTIIILQQAGHAIGWGFQLQSPAFLAFMAILFFFIGLSMSGTINIPSIFGNVGGNAAAKGGKFGSFATGSLAALVATPCTVPFMAPAIGFALTISPVQSLLIFAMLGLGMAMPFILISISPKFAKIMPKAGAWMDSLKKWLALPIYATVLWLLWVLSRQEVGILPMNATIFAIAIISLIILLQSIFTNISWLKNLLSIAVIAMIVALIYNIAVGNLDTKNIDNNVNYEQFSHERLATLRADNKAVFVNATADWCLTCKLNELTSLSTNKVQNHFKTNGITTLKADWTNHDATISNYINSFGRSGVPLYVFYPASGGEPKLLPQILTPSVVIENTSN